MPRQDDVRYATPDTLEHLEAIDWLTKSTSPYSKSPFKNNLTAIKHNEKHHGHWIPLAVYSNVATASSTKYRLAKQCPEFGFGVAHARPRGVMVIAIYPKPPTRQTDA